MRKFNFIDGVSYDVMDNECRGCFMVKNEDKMSDLLNPIYKNKGIVVRQDAEWPIPAFYIVSIDEHIGSISDLDDRLCIEIILIIKKIRKGLKDLFGIDRAQIYHEEKINAPHFHIWILPLWNDVMKKNNIYPKIYESNVKQYIDLFKYESTKKKIKECNEKMKKYLSEGC